MKKATKTIEVDIETFIQITRLAKAMKMPKKRFLGELVNRVFDIGSQFDELIIQYSGRFTGAWLKLNFSGRSNIIYGMGTEQQLEETLRDEP